MTQPTLSASTSVTDITLNHVAYMDPTMDLGGQTARPSLDVKDAGTDKASPADDQLVDQTLYLPPSRVALVVLSIATSYCMAVMEQTVLAVALPSIATSFNAGQKASWAVNSFLIGSAAVSPLYGRFADIWSRKAIMLSAMSIFFFSTIGCAFCTSLMQLIVFRAFQGVGVTGVTVTATVVLSDVVPLTERGRYQGIIETLCVSMQCIGPLLGGVLVSKLTWRAVFWILLPIIAITVVLQIIFVPAKKMTGDWRAKLAKIDWIGVILSLGWVILLLIGMTRGGVETAWNSPATICCFVFSGVLFVVLFVWEAKGATLPIIPPRMFTISSVLSVHLTTLAAMAAHFIVLYYIPQYLQVVRGFSIIKSGLAVVPYGGLLSSFVFIGTQLIRHVSLRYLIIGGFACWTIFAGLLTRLDGETSLGQIVGILAFGGAGGGICLIIPLFMLQAATQRADTAVAMSSYTSAKLIGAAIGTATAAAIVSNSMTSKLEALGLSASLIRQVLDTPESIQHELKEALDPSVLVAIIAAYVKTYKTVWHIVLGCAGFSFVVSVILLRHHELAKPDDELQKEAGKAWLAAQKAAKKDSQASTEVEAEKV